MSRSMTLTFTTNSHTYDIATYGGVLSDATFMPRQPILRFVEITGRSQPLDISRAATGSMTYTSAVYTYVVSIVGSDTISANNSNARLLVAYINGKVCEVASGPDGTYDAEVAVTNYERVGEFVRITIECTEVS